MLDKEVKFMSKRCPNCGHEIQDGDTFCIHCGYKLVQNQKNELTKNNDKSSSLKNKWQPKKSIKVLETSSENIHEEQTQEFWKKKTFWIAVVVLAIMVLIVKETALPKGYSNPSDVMEYCMKRDILLNDMEGRQELSNEVADVFGVDNDEERHELLQNKKTKRYVFRYSYNGESIPSYVVAEEANDGTYSADIIPAKKSHIASIFKYDLSQDYMDRHFPSDKYIGYSNNDYTDMDVKLDDNISNPHTSGKTWVSYDKSENE